MTVAVVLDQRYFAASDGRIWTSTVHDYSFWQRYLGVFDSVKVVARAKSVTATQPSWRRVDGPGVSLYRVPYYVGPWQYLRAFPRVWMRLRNAVHPEDAVILRVSSQLALHVASHVIKAGHPFALEVVGDPHDALAPGCVRSIVRPFYRWWATRSLKHICSKAHAVSYVTQSYLQRRYPPGALQFGISDVDISDYSAGGAPVFTTHFSSVDVDRAFFAERVKSKNERAQRLLFIGSLSQMYKGADILVQALATCVRKGLDVNLEIVGDGRHRPDLESLVERLRLGRRVTFLGELPPGSAIRERLDSADVFVLPSRSEGLPRAMVEAMARGLPCIGTTVGGIPELLPPEDMVPPGNVDLLASLIEDVCINPKRMERMAMRNLAKAAEYRDDVLRSRRNDFYRHIRQETAKWLESKAGPPSTLT